MQGSLCAVFTIQLLLLLFVVLLIINLLKIISNCYLFYFNVFYMINLQNICIDLLVFIIILNLFTKTVIKCLHELYIDNNLNSLECP